MRVARSCESLRSFCGGPWALPICVASPRPAVCYLSRGVRSQAIECVAQGSPIHLFKQPLLGATRYEAGAKVTE